MKSGAALIFSGLLLAFTASAQHGGHSGGGHSGGGHSGGGGGGRTGSVSGRGGYGAGYGAGYGGGYGRSYGATIVGPGIYPSLGYGFYSSPYGSNYVDPGYASGYAAPLPPQDVPPPDYYYGPGGGQPLPPPTEGQPPDDSLRIYQAPAPSPGEQALTEGRYYLIAYKDHSVYTALAFWMENGVLNYVTPQNVHNQISLDLLDMDLTKQLNSRRGLAFNIVNR